MPEGAGRFPFELIGYQINRTARATRALLDARLAERGVTFADWVVLITLATRGDQIQRDLARLVDVEGPTMVRRLDQLEGAGLVARSPVPADRRATRISLTGAGRHSTSRCRRPSGTPTRSSGQDSTPRTWPPPSGCSGASPTGPGTCACAAHPRRKARAQTARALDGARPG